MMGILSSIGTVQTKALGMKRGVSRKISQSFHEGELEQTREEKIRSLKLYRPMWGQIIFLAIQVWCLQLEEIKESSHMERNIHDFIIGTSPACIDDSTPCVNLLDVHDWYSTAVWVNQSIIKTFYGNYGGEGGLILQELSLGEEVVIWTARAKINKECPASMRKFIKKCVQRSDEFDTSDWVFMNETMVYEKDVNDKFPRNPPYEANSLGGSFYKTINTTLTEDSAVDEWDRLYQNEFFNSKNSMSMTVMFLVASPRAEHMTLVEINFQKELYSGSITTGFSMSSFNLKESESFWMKIAYSGIFVFTFFYLAAEVLTILGFKKDYNKPWHQHEKATTFMFGFQSSISDIKKIWKPRSIVLSVYEYFSGFDFWNGVDWLLIWLGLLSSLLYYKRSIWMGKAIAALNDAGPNVKAYAELLNAANNRFYHSVCFSILLLVNGFRIFKCVQFHKRLGQITNTIAVATTSISHFILVFVFCLAVFCMCGYLLFGRSMEEFENMSESFITMLQMITGDVALLDLISAYGSTTMEYNPVALIPVYLFYFGFFFVIVMLLLNVLLAIIIDSYNSVYEETKNFKTADYNVFSDMWLCVCLTFDFVTCASAEKPPDEDLYLKNKGSEPQGVLEPNSHHLEL